MSLLALSKQSCYQNNKKRSPKIGERFFIQAYKLITLHADIDHAIATDRYLYKHLPNDRFALVLGRFEHQTQAWLVD